MKHEGRGVIRLHDETTHGGVVITASGPTMMGLPAALHGDMTHCPKCKGDFAIVADSAGAKHHGRQVAYHGAVSACGTRLIASV